MKKYILLYIMILCFTKNTQAQIKITSDMLINKEWKIQLPEGSTSYPQGCIYSTTKETTFMISPGNKRYEYSNDYYLSDTPENIFNSTKIGKSQSGKYLVVNNKKKSANNQSYYYEVLNYEIQECTSSTLILKNLKYNIITTLICE